MSTWLLGDAWDRNHPGMLTSRKSALKRPSIIAMVMASDIALDGREEDLDMLSLDESLSLASSAEIRQRSLRRLWEVIENFPQEEKDAYYQAKERCPCLIETETKPLKCLIYHRFDVWKAAYQVLSYWKLRKELFGQRFALPLHQTGNGAMSPTDIRRLSTGVWSVTPATVNPHGKPVNVLVPSRRPSDDLDYETSCRVIFYTMSVIMDTLPLQELEHFTMFCLDGRGVNEGNNGLGRVGTTFDRLQSFTRRITKVFPLVMSLCYVPMTLTQDGAPAQNSSTTMSTTAEGAAADPTAATNETRSFWSVVAPALVKAMPYGWAARLEFVSANTAEGSVLQQLNQRFGFYPEGIPVECGGTWDLTKYRQRQQERLQLEQQREAAPVLAAILQAHAEQKTRKQEYQRYQHLKRRKSFQSLKITSNACIEENKRLRAESARLEQLLGQAAEVVKTCMPSGVPQVASFPALFALPIPLPPPIAAVQNYKDVTALERERRARREVSKQRRRVLNRGYSRIKRHRRKAEQTEVRASYAAVISEHEQLEAESARLTGLREAAVRVLTSHGLPLPPSWTSLVATAPLKNDNDEEK